MYQAPRGTSDILPASQPYWSHLCSRLETTAQNYGYQRIDTPIFESTNLFLRTVGAATDIVQKEMYTFQDRGRQELTLRPEGTAPVCRAYIEGGLHNLPQPVRLYYLCPMFRYDRPQAGRYRQFHQFGVEVIGDADATIDAEVIQLSLSIIRSIGLNDVNLLLNSIGNSDDRPAYFKALQSYYKPFLARLCKDCQHRYERNPLRLLDCKNATCSPYLDAAPRSVDHLDKVSQIHWETLLGHLQDLNITYSLDHRLVRGLDYYTRTVFELQPSQEGSQNTLCAGGRYDGLVKDLGGPNMPGIGFAAGLERLILNMQHQEIELTRTDSLSVMMAYLGAQAKVRALQIVSNLRDQGITAVLAPEKSLKAQMRYASSISASHTLILGNEELANGTIVIRDMASGSQQESPIDEIVLRLQKR